MYDPAMPPVSIPAPSALKACILQAYISVGNSASTIINRQPRVFAAHYLRIAQWLCLQNFVGATFKFFGKCAHGNSRHQKVSIQGASSKNLSSVA